MTRAAEFRTAEGIDAVGDDFQGVDVEAGIGFVQDGEAGLQKGHLQDFVTLFLAPGKADIDVALQHVIRHREIFDGGAGKFQECDGVQLRFAAGAADGIEGRADEIGVADAGQFDRVLEGQEDAGGGALLGLHRQQILAVEMGGAAGHLVAVAAGKHVGERGLAGAVRAHDGVNFAVRDGEVNAAEDFLAFDRGGEVFDF